MPIDITRLPSRRAAAAPVAVRPKIDVSRLPSRRQITVAPPETWEQKTLREHQAGKSLYGGKTRAPYDEALINPETITRYTDRFTNYLTDKASKAPESLRKPLGWLAGGAGYATDMVAQTANSPVNWLMGGLVKAGKNVPRVTSVVDDLPKVTSPVIKPKIEVAAPPIESVINKARQPAAETNLAKAISLTDDPDEISRLVTPVRPKSNFSNYLDVDTEVQSDIAAKTARDNARFERFMSPSSRPDTPTYKGNSGLGFDAETPKMPMGKDGQLYVTVPKSLWPRRSQSDIANRVPSAAIESPTPMPRADTLRVEMPEVVKPKQSYRELMDKVIPIEAKEVSKVIESAAKSTIPEFQAAANNPKVVEEIANSIRRSSWRYFYDQAGTSGSTQLRNLGATKAANLLEYTKTEGNRLGGQWAQKVIDWKKQLTTKQQADVFDILDGRVPSVRKDKVDSAAVAMRSLLDEIGEAAEKSKMSLHIGQGEFIPFQRMEGSYAPRIYPKEFFKDPTKVKDALIASGKTPEQATAITKAMAKSHEGGSSAYFGERLISPQHSREFGLEGYHRNLNALEKHAYDMGKRVTEATHLGPKDIADSTSPISNLLKGVSEPESARKIVDNYLGRSARPDSRLAEVANKVIKFETATKLSQFVINNTTNALTTIIRLGSKNTGKALIETLSNYGGAKSKATADGALAILQKEALLDIENGNLLSKAYGINAQETFLRTLSSLAGRAAARDSAIRVVKNPNDRVAIRTLKMLLGDKADEVIKTGKISDELVSFAGGRGAEMTQGIPDALTLPPILATTNPIAKLPFLFKRFAFLNTKNVVDALKANPKLIPLAAGLFTVGGEAAGDAKAVIKGATMAPFNDESIGENIGREVGNRGEFINTAGVYDSEATVAGYDVNQVADRLIANMFQSWLFGLPGEVGEAVMSGGSRAAGLFVGPVGNDALEAFDVTNNFIKGKLKPAAKAVVRRIPYIGSGLGASVPRENEGRSLRR